MFLLPRRRPRPRWSGLDDATVAGTKLAGPVQINVNEQWAMGAIDSDSYLHFEWDANEACTTLYIATNSAYQPK